MKPLKIAWLLILVLLMDDLGIAQPNLKPVNTETIAELVLNKGLATVDMSLYPGSLLMQGMSELAVLQKDGKLLGRTIALFNDYRTQKIKAQGSFISYQVGGTGAAYLDFLNKTDQLSGQVKDGAERMYKSQKRTSDGLMTAPWLKDSLDQVMIDCAFAVTPFLLYAGLKYNNRAYVDLAIHQTVRMFDIFKDPNGLIHQARGFQGLNTITKDNWSRGNGWGSFALASLMRDLPDTHPRKKEVNRIAKNFFEAVLKHQNEEGLWNQEMTDHTSYVETSGSGLLLFGIGIAIEKKVIDKSFLPQFIKGLRGYTSYIGEDGSVSHATIGCLSPGQGTKQDYIKRMWEFNDPHSFGPAVLAFTQAAKMGIKSVQPLKSLGIYAQNPYPNGKPRAYVTYMPEANGNILWENDRIAFRVYGPPVKDRVSSGIDVWTKSVAYPIIDKWYKLNAEGKEYHVDRGEGCDFFHVGFTRGNGGTAIWHNDKPYISQTYASHKILKNTSDEIAFELTFDPWDVEGTKVWEKKVIRMKMGTNLFKVESTFYSESATQLTVGIGIAFAENPEVITDEHKGTLTIWEAYMPSNGELGTAILVNPMELKGFRSFEKEKYVLVNIKAGQPITYYVGAGWSKSPQSYTKQAWFSYVNQAVSGLTF